MGIKKGRACLAKPPLFIFPFSVCAEYIVRCINLTKGMSV